MLAIELVPLPDKITVTNPDAGKEWLLAAAQKAAEAKTGRLAAYLIYPIWFLSQEQRDIHYLPESPSMILGQTTLKSLNSVRKGINKLIEAGIIERQIVDNRRYLVLRPITIKTPQTL